MVDIIICVHNAYDDVVRCFDSVIKNSDLDFNIIIVDDGSESVTANFLVDVKNKHDNVTLIRNEVGHGYTFAVNMGIDYAKSDYIVLLNSDTIVPEGWLSKLIKPLMKNDELGITGPLSNVASWQSIPRINGLDGDWFYNTLPEGMDVTTYSKIVEKYASTGEIYVPLLNGFCLAIKRKVFDKIGKFDIESFPNGYGEEDDFNIRVFEAGFKLAIVTTCYVYHAQSKSYSDDRRKELCKISGETLKKKHGESIIKEKVNYIKDSYELLGVRARARNMLEREDIINRGRKIWNGKSILILLVSESLSGGVNVILQEAEKMIDMGVRVELFNLYKYKEKFEESYKDINIPINYGMNRHDFLELTNQFDAVCATFNDTLKYFDGVNSRCVYYIQDYEPYFYDDNSEEYNTAKESYMRKNIVLVTKTKWNAKVLMEQCGVTSSVLGPSVNVDLFKPKSKKKDGIIRISAMVRPSSERRGPLMTMKVLNNIKSNYGEKVEINIFGFDNKVESKFLQNKETEFDYNYLGIIDRPKMMEVLQASDIFVDFSTYQAMGLTSMEAMACGCAVISPKKGGFTEIGVNEHNCLIIDTEDFLECVSALKKLIDDDTLRETIEKNAINEICEYYPEKAAYIFLESTFENCNYKKATRLKKTIANNVFPKGMTTVINSVDSVYIYGAGHFAKLYNDFLLEEGVKFEGFIVSDRGKNPIELLGKPVITIDEFDINVDNKNKIGIIVAIEKNDGIKETIKARGFNNIYMHGE